MSSGSSSSKFDVQKWNDAIRAASKLVAERLITNPDVEREPSNTTGWVAPNDNEKLCVMFCCDITAPHGTYPTFEEQTERRGPHLFFMSQDIFEHYKLGATLVMQRFGVMVIKECNTILKKVEIVKHSNFDTSIYASDAIYISTYLKVRAKQTEAAQQQQQQPQSRMLGWLFSQGV